MPVALRNNFALRLCFVLLASQATVYSVIEYAAEARHWVMLGILSGLGSLLWLTPMAIVTSLVVAAVAAHIRGLAFAASDGKVLSAAVRVVTSLTQASLVEAILLVVASALIGIHPLAISVVFRKAVFLGPLVYAVVRDVMREQRALSDPAKPRCDVPD